MKKSKNITGFDFLWLALYTTAAFLFELLLVTGDFNLSCNKVSDDCSLDSD